MTRNLSSTSANKQQGMMRHEAGLPNLPVNSLAETSARWLESIRPFVTEPGQPLPTAEKPNERYLRAQQAAEEFLDSPLVKQLQQRLQDRASKTDSWLADWWNEAAYLRPRDPLAFANYFYAHVDDLSRKDPAKRAASLVRAVLFFRRMLETDVLEPEMVKTTPLAMNSYEYLFNTCRYPGKEIDTAKKFDPDTHNHIVVLRRNKFYEVPIMASSGDFLSEADLQQQFQRIIDQAGPEDDPNPIGVLTTGDRSVWAQAREDLVNLSSKNAKSLEKIESAIILVCLDSTKPVTRDQLSWNLWVGDKPNRFMDKHQIIVTENGKSGFNGEHSMSDGTPTLRINEFMLRGLAQQKIDLGSPTPDTKLAQPRQLLFEVDKKVKSHIAQATEALDKLKGEHEMHVLNYEGYGKNVIKAFKTSPDSWAQLTMAYAYYKMTGRLAPTYESAQTRKFKRGRTEVIRSATPEVLEWCQVMESDAPAAKKAEMMKRAAGSHIKYAGLAADGKGVDRHFFGLKKLLQPGEELPSIFSDPAFGESSNWVLSTSQLSSEYFNCWGYSEVVPEGFGLAYSVNNESLRFCICTRTGKAKELAHYIGEAATELRQMQTAAAGGEKAKL